ncbi:MAG: hypothetical protein GXP25_11910 [Planctomycetes bacterium]|nr:hypothetical protein [Planctomycetota bacterium]
MGGVLNPSRLLCAHCLVLGIGLAVCGHISAAGPNTRVVAVSVPTALQQALDAAEPGDVIEVADGLYSLSGDLTITRSGTEAKPIFIRAKHRGRAEITGRGEVLFKEVAHVVMEGFTFTHCARYRGWPWGNVTLQDCHHVRFTRNTLHLCEDRSMADKKGLQQWVCITGRRSHHNRIDHNLFDRKTMRGDFIAITGDDYGGECCSQHDRIDHNHFRDYQHGGGQNMLETIRAGSNDDGANDVSAFLTIEDNLFERCNGEVEMISLKCSDNRVLRNTILDCHGSVSLRLSNRSVVAGNFFIQTDKADPKLRYGGVRFYGSGHKVYNNYFENLNGYGMCAPLNIMPGSYEQGQPQPERGVVCTPAKNCQVVFNTWVNCNTLRLGYDSSARPLPPRGCVFANNILYGGRDGEALVRFFEAEGIACSGNILFPRGAAKIEVSDADAPPFRIVDPGLAQTEGVWRLETDNGPAANAATGKYLHPTEDMDGQLRGAPPDLGADEYSTLPVRYRPLTPRDVGPDAGPFDP